MILALLVGCALRRNELAELDVETIQRRDGRWFLADLEGKGRRIRTVAVPIWVEHGTSALMTAAGIEDGRLLRSVSKSEKIKRDTLSNWAVWSIVEQFIEAIGIEHLRLTACEGLAPSYVVRTAGIWSRSNSCSGTHRSRPPNDTLAQSRTLRSQ